MFNRGVVKRYWENVVVKNGCWSWAGSHSRGYGQIYAGYKKSPAKAHRVSWFIHNGGIPKNLAVCHKCDNPECSNPEHLFLATQKENMVDAFQKGRLYNFNHGKGEKNNAATLSNTDVKKIRADYCAGKTADEIAREYGHTNIRRVVRNQVYYDPEFTPVNGNRKPRPWRRKLTQCQIDEILTSPLPSRALAKKYGVSKTTILETKNRKTKAR